MGEKHFFHFSTAVSGTVYLFHFDSWREDEQSMRFIFQGIFDRIRDLLPSCILPGKVKSNQLNMILFPQTLLKKLGLIDKTVSSFFFFKGHKSKTNSQIKGYNDIQHTWFSFIKCFLL